MSMGRGAARSRNGKGIPHYPRNGKKGKLCQITYTPRLANGLAVRPMNDSGISKRWLCFWAGRKVARNLSARGPCTHVMRAAISTGVPTTDACIKMPEN